MKRYCFPIIFYPGFNRLLSSTQYKHHNFLCGIFFARSLSLIFSTALLFFLSHSSHILHGSIHHFVLFVAVSYIFFAEQQQHQYNCIIFTTSNKTNNDLSIYNVYCCECNKKIEVGICVSMCL